MWHPLTSLTHLLDYQLSGLNPARHHLTNLILHIGSTLLLFGILKRMTGTVWPAFFVAAAFAVHPLNVESVAWVAERKNVLSGFFWMLTLTAYIPYARRPSIGRYLLLIFIFALAAMTKPIVVTLPFVLLLLDYWPLFRLQVRFPVFEEEASEPESERAELQGPPAWCLVAEKVPLFVISAALSAITFIVQQKGGTVSGLGNVPMQYRILNALVSYATYIGKMLWPARLAVFYPHLFDKLPTWQVTLSTLLLMFVSVLVFWPAWSRKYMTVGWLWFLGTLVPVIGLVQVGAQAMADRYTYLPLIGLFIMIAWGLRDLSANRRFLKITFCALALVALAALAICTRLQLRHWKNNKALFEHAISVTEDNFIMNNNYANILNKTGQVEEAIDHFYKALRIRPISPEIHNNLGNALRNLGRTDEAIRHYEKALKLRPSFAQAHYNLAVALAAQGKTDEAIAQYYEALRFRPHNFDTLSNLGYALAQKGNLNEAVEYYRRALALEPENVIAHGRLGLTLAGLDKIGEAIEQFRIVLKASPDDVEMHCNLGILLERQGKTDEAIEAYQRAVQIDPNYTRAQNLLKAALKKQENR
jgi:tetratricopeptide (TPR) repeat protein